MINLLFTTKCKLRCHLQRWKQIRTIKEYFQLNVPHNQDNVPSFSEQPFLSILRISTQNQIAIWKMLTPALCNILPGMSIFHQECPNGPEWPSSHAQKQKKSVEIDLKPGRF